MGHRQWPVLDALKVAYCEERGLDPGLTSVKIQLVGGELAVVEHSHVQPGFYLEPGWSEDD